ncbi:MAG: hypothetical protein KAZ30_00255 [Candidatus Magasanikbacteria bacterium]|nr:hypothetical protein [Candidatus Magasanikbacteria bacterium]
MKQFPPHLPPPACSVPHHNYMQRLLLLIIAVISGLAAGTVGALLMINAWYPTGLTSSAEYAAPRASTRPVLDSNVVRDWRPRLIAVYDENKAVNKKYFPETARLTTAVIVNAGGWSVAPWSTAFNKASLVGTDYQGQRLAVERFIPDPERQLVYIKFSGANFRSTTVFAGLNALTPGRLVWSGSSDWHLATIDEPVMPSGLISTVSVDKTVYTLRELSKSQQVLITDRGEFVGFSAPEQKIIPVWMINQIISQLAANTKTIPVWSFDWRGTFVELTASEQGFVQSAGFLITEITRASANHPIKVGDQIIKINNQNVTRENFVELLTLAPESFTATVLRQEETIEIIITK